MEEYEMKISIHEKWIFLAKIGKNIVRVIHKTNIGNKFDNCLFFDIVKFWVRLHFYENTFVGCDNDKVRMLVKSPFFFNTGFAYKTVHSDMFKLKNNRIIWYINYGYLLKFSFGIIFKTLHFTIDNRQLTGVCKNCIN